LIECKARKHGQEVKKEELVFVEALSLGFSLGFDWSVCRVSFIHEKRGGPVILLKKFAKMLGETSSIDFEGENGMTRDLPSPSSSE